MWPASKSQSSTHRRLAQRLTAPGALFKQAFMLSMSLAAIFPVYYMVVTSLKTDPQWLNNRYGLPLPPSFDEYIQVLTDGRVTRWLLNSVIVTGAAVILSTVVATLAAFAVARVPFRGRTFFLQAMIALMVIPPAIIILPVFLIMQPLGLVNTYQGVVLIYAGMMVPFSVYMLVSFFRKIPSELFEAARIDGASTVQLLTSIVVPLSMPAFMTLIVVNALWAWNELLIALVFLQDDSMRTMMPGITLFKGHFAPNEPLVMSASFVGMLPLLLLFLFGQRFFVRGLVAGAVK